MRLMPPNALKNAAARQALQSRVRRALAAEGPVPSPCISVCRMDSAAGLCIGCLRSLDEITGWSALDDRGRRDIWLQLSQRAHAPQAGSVTDPGASSPPV